MTIKTFPTLYKKTSAGKTQIWYQEIEGSKFRTVHGQKDGKKSTSEWTQAEGTNVGRANERSPEQQAVFEVAATYKKKLDKDYHETEEAIEEGAKIFECMLAYDINKRLEKKVSKKNPEFSYEGAFSQPKLNGMRCIAKANGLWTRNGKPIVSCPHIVEILAPFFERFPNAVLDGELYNHELKHDFDELMSIFKQQKPTAEDLAKSKEHGQLHLYDITIEDHSKPIHGVAKRGEDAPLTIDTLYFDRLDILGMIQEEIESYAPGVIHLSRTDKIDSKEDAERCRQEYLAEGYEGQMIRLNWPYENDRSWGLLKVKDFFDGEFILLDIQEGKGNWAGKAKRAVLLNSYADPNNYDPKEDTFDAGITGTMEYCAKLLKEKEKYIGKKTTVNYQVINLKGTPIFGRCKEFDRMDV